MNIDSSTSVVVKLAKASTLLFVHFIVAFVVLLVLVKVVPTYWVLFDKLDAQLPMLTIKALRMSDFAVDYWWWAFPAFLAMDGFLLLGFQWLPTRLAWIRSCWFAGLLLAAVLYLGFVQAVLSVPVHVYLFPEQVPGMDSSG